MGGRVALGAVRGLGVAGRPEGQSEGPKQSLRAALREAAGHRGYWLLNAGFFVCGFQLVFIATHFPAYLTDHGLGLAVGAQSLALIGLFNIFGSYIFGLSGDFLRTQYLLSGLYVARVLVIYLFLALPAQLARAPLLAPPLGFPFLG